MEMEYSVQSPQHGLDTLPRNVATMMLDGLHILVVEDDVELRDLIHAALTRSGSKVSAVGSSYAALKCLDGALAGQGAAVDLVISDLMLSGRDRGMDLAASVRDRMPEMPILLISGYADDRTRQSLEDEGYPFLRKPFTRHQLTEAVRGLLGKS